MTDWPRVRALTDRDIAAARDHREASMRLPRTVPVPTPLCR
jgi:hypothetical protein